jgi:hypothetical protein
VPVHPGDPSTPVVSVESSDLNTTVLTFSMNGFYKNEVLGSGASGYTISVPGMSPLLKAGAPDLCSFSSSVIIPDQGEMDIQVISSTYVDYPGLSILPSKGNLLRTQDPSAIPYRYGSEYRNDTFWPASFASLRAPFVIRDYRGQTAVFTPFQYNPVTRSLRVYSGITIRISKKEGRPGMNEISRSHLPSQLDREFAAIYGQEFKNFPAVQYQPLEEDGSLLIICNSAWMSLMQPLVDWKIRKGIPTELVDVSAIGISSTAIQSYISAYYAAHNLKYVLLVGDVAQVPTITAQGGASDPSYGYLAGADSYAEVFVGRFSAANAADVSTQVQRTISYEANPDTTQNWFGKGVVIGSNLGPGDDNEMDWEHERNIKTDLTGFTYTSVAELYDATHPSTADQPGDPTDMDLVNVIQDGIGFMTYTGHGSSTSIGTTNFSNNDISILTNYHMLPFIWSVACVNGDFAQTSGPCFAEAFLRAQDNGQPTGAIATFMSSINQSWNPPMDAQDEMVDLLVQSVAGNIKRSFAGLSVNGCMHMNDQYGAAGDEMTDTWHCFGDPTLNVWTKTPQAMAVSHAPLVPIGTGSFSLNCSANGAYVSLNVNGQIIASGFVNNGMVLLNFAPLTTVDTMFVTVTGFNQYPYSGYVLVIPAAGPFVVYQSNVSHEAIGNNDGLVDENESINVDVTLENLGGTDATSITAVLSSVDPYVTLNTFSLNVPFVVANSAVTIPNGFAYSVSNAVPDQHVVLFTITCTDGNGNTWTSSFTQTINAPSLAIGSPVIDDSQTGNGNGILEAGESGTITFRCHNNGHADAYSTNASLTSISPYLTIGSGTVAVGTLLKLSYADVTYPVSLNSNISTGTAYDLTLALAAGNYAAQGTFYKNAGILLEDFETNTLTKFDWTTSGAMPWLTTTYLPFEGNYCAVSGDINDNERSELELVVNVLADDSVNYWYAVSSEQGWDFLRFYIDGVSQSEQSGILPWSYAGAPITSGVHTLKFSYEKDSYYSANMDCAWLDNIKLPPVATVTAIHQFISKDGFAVYPVPAEQEINVQFNLVSGGAVSVAIMDLNGRKLSETVEQKFGSGIHTVVLPVEELAAGMYFVSVRTGSEMRTMKISIVR